MLIPNFKKLARKKSGLLHEADSNFKRENPHLEKHYEFALRIGVTLDEADSAKHALSAFWSAEIEQDQPDGRWQGLKHHDAR